MNEILHLINEMSPYLLLGFLLAGIMHAFVPTKIYHKYLSKNNFKSVLYAALFGIPLPLCSCGVIPTAMSLRREGASKGATVSFLIATPQTGVDSIIATYALMGLPFAILRPVAALFTSLFGGLLVNIFNKNDSIVDNENAVYSEEFKGYTFFKRIVEALKYGFVDMMQSIGKWLIIGLIVAGLITTLVPDNFFAIFADNSLLSMLIVLIVAIPMYLCATGSIPIAVALILKGLSPGTALVLLMAGPAVNAASILVINKVLGRKTLLIYLFAIISGAIFFGLCIDYILPTQWFTSTLNVASNCSAHTAPQYFNIACTIILFILLANAFLLRFLRKNNNCSCKCECNKSQENNIINEQEPEFKVINIEGMHCIHCAKSVKRAIAEIDGVESVTVDLDNKTATVKGKVSTELIHKAISSLGFKPI